MKSINIFTFAFAQNKLKILNINNIYVTRGCKLHLIKTHIQPYGNPTLRIFNKLFSSRLFQRLNIIFHSLKQYII